MKNIHPTTENMNIVVGGIYAFTNKHNYTTTIKVTRVTDKSIFASRKLQDGSWGGEVREGVKEFSKFTIVK